jgi:Txe/YoeB family toxin of Txe-Axe toxin-antitoxin module
MSAKSELKSTNGSEEFQIYETQSFQKSLNKYKHLQPAIENKLRFLKNNPFSGEPLKYELSGFRSIRVKRNFLILYGICRECKKSKEMSGSTSCPGYGDNAVVVYAFGPHDDLYKIARKIIQKKAKR